MNLMGHTLKQRSALVTEAERRERLERITSLGDHIVGAVGIIGCAAVLVLLILGGL